MKSFGFYLHGSQYFRAQRAWRTKSSQLEVLINIFRGSMSSFCFWKVQDNRSPNRRLVPSPPNPMTSWSFHDITCSWRGSYTLPSPYCTRKYLQSLVAGSSSLPTINAVQCNSPLQRNALQYKSMQCNALHKTRKTRCIADHKRCTLYWQDCKRSSRKSSGEAILGSGLVFLLDWGYDTHQNKIIEIHVSKATYINKDYTYS